MMRRAHDCGVPNLEAEIRFWQTAFGLDDWTIEARHVEDLRYPCSDAGEGYPAKGARMAGLCDVDIPAKRAWISVQRPRNMTQLRAWPEVVLHEVMHVLGASTRAPGWTIQQEHRTINAIVPTLAKARRRTPDLAARAARTLAEAYRRAAVEIAARRASPNDASVPAIAAMTVTPRSSGSR